MPDLYFLMTVFFLFLSFLKKLKLQFAVGTCFSDKIRADFKWQEFFFFTKALESDNSFFDSELKNPEFDLNKNNVQLNLLYLLLKEVQEIKKLYENQVKNVEIKRHAETFDLYEAAVYLKCDVKTLKRYYKITREVAFHKVGRRIVFLKKDLDTFLEKKRKNCFF